MISLYNISKYSWVLISLVCKVLFNNFKDPQLQYFLPSLLNIQQFYSNKLVPRELLTSAAIRNRDILKPVVVTGMSSGYK